MRGKNRTKSRFLNIVEDHRELTEGAPWVPQEHPVLVVKSYLDFLDDQDPKPGQAIRH